MYSKLRELLFTAISPERYSIMASAKVNQVEPFVYVRNLLVQFSGKRPDDPSALLPDVWLKTHSEAHRRWSR